MHPIAGQQQIAVNYGRLVVVAVAQLWTDLGEHCVRRIGLVGNPTFGSRCRPIAREGVFGLPVDRLGRHCGPDEQHDFSRMAD